MSGTGGRLRPTCRLPREEVSGPGQPPPLLALCRRAIIQAVQGGISMKSESTSGFVVQPSFRRLLLACMAALVVLAFALPGLAQDLPDGKTAEQPKANPVATATPTATELVA